MPPASVVAVTVTESPSAEVPVNVMVTPASRGSVGSATPLAFWSTYTSPLTWLGGSWHPQVVGVIRSSRAWRVSRRGRGRRAGTGANKKANIGAGSWARKVDKSAGPVGNGAHYSTRPAAPAAKAR